MRYAVNLADLTTFAQKDSLINPVMMLLGPVLDKSGGVLQLSSERWDEMGILVRDNIEDGRFEAIHEIIRKQIPKHKLRIYRSKSGKSGWKRI